LYSYYATSRLNVRFKLSSIIVCVTLRARIVLSEMAASHTSRRYTHSAITTTSTIITA